MNKIIKIDYKVNEQNNQELLDLLSIRALMSKSNESCGYYEIVENAEQNGYEVITSWPGHEIYDSWIKEESNEKIEKKIEEISSKSEQIMNVKT